MNLWELLVEGCFWGCLFFDFFILLGMWEEWFLVLGNIFRLEMLILVVGKGLRILKSWGVRVGFVNICCVLKFVINMGVY